MKKFVPWLSMEPRLGPTGKLNSWAESPSGSMPSSGISTRIESPASTRAVSGFGVGSWLPFGSRPITVKVAVAVAVSPNGSSTR